MKKKILFIITVVSLMFAINLLAEENMGLKGFIKDLNVNQDNLGFSSYGLLEHSSKIDVKIYSNKEKLEGLKSFIAKYNYFSVNYNIDNNIDAHDVVITVTFAKVTKIVSPKNNIVKKDDKKNNTKNKIAEKEPKLKKEEKAVKIKKKKKCPRRVKVEVDAVTVKPFTIFKNFKLEVLPANEMVLTALAEGIISEIMYENEESVEKGQLFLKLDKKNINEELQVLKQKLKDWKTNLFKREHWKIRSPRAEDNAKKIISETMELINTKEKELADMSIAVNMPGNIFHNLSVGDKVEKDSAIAKIVNSSKMMIELPSADINLFKINDKVNLRFNDISELYSGTVVNFKSKLVIEIDNSNNLLKKGMVAKFKVVKEIITDMVVIKSDWILSDENGSFVYIVNGKRAQKVYIIIKTIDTLKKESLIKSGLLKDDEIILTNVDCLTDKKKIKVMVVDEKTGKLVKRKKKSKTVKVEPTKERKINRVKTVDVKSVIEEDMKESFFKLSVGAGYHYIADSIFSDIYGNGLIAGSFEASYTIKNKFEIFMGVDYISKKGNFTELSEEVSLTMMPMYFGGKYNFQTKGKIKPFVGIAFTSYAVKEKSDEEEISLTTYGPSILVGVNMSLNQKLDLFFKLKYDAVQLEIEALDNEKLDISGSGVVLGVSYRF